MPTITIQDSEPFLESLDSLLRSGRMVIADTNCILSARYLVESRVYARQGYSDLINDLLSQQLSIQQLEQCVESFVAETERMQEGLYSIINNPNRQLFTTPEVVHEIKSSVNLLKFKQHCRFISGLTQLELRDLLDYCFSAGIAHLSNIYDFLWAQTETSVIDGPFRQEESYWQLIDHLRKAEVPVEKPFLINNNPKPLYTDANLVATAFFASGLYSSKFGDFGYPVAILSNDCDIDALISQGNELAKTMFAGYDVSCSKIGHRTGRLIKHTQVRHAQGHSTFNHHQ